MSRTTIMDIARAAGVSRATVSYALNNHRKIATATRDRIHALAESMGYRPDTTLAGQLARIRRGERVHTPETLAFAWLEPQPASEMGLRFNQFILDGAKHQARTLGYRVEIFDVHKAALSAHRFEAILKARGIRGVIFGPVVRRSFAHLRMDWHSLSMVCIGQAMARPILHRSVHNHFEGITLCLRKLRHLGFTRPALILDALTHERSRRAWLGGFLAHHPLGAAAGRLTQIVPQPFPTDAELRRWLDDVQADALMVEAPDTATGVALPVFTLNWHPHYAHNAGVDQNYAAIAAHAVDLLIGELAHNRLGIPTLPKTLITPPRWQPDDA